jgi:hypothetical protein
MTEKHLAGSRDYGVSNPGFNGFVQEVGRQLNGVNETTNTLASLSPPTGADQRIAAADNSIQRLAHSLEAMTNAERWQWARLNESVLDTLGLAGSDDMGKAQDAILQWAHLTIALSGAVTDRPSKPNPSKSESAGGVVELLALAWLKHYGRWPSGAERSPFYLLINHLLPALPLKVAELSHPTVMAILRDSKPS